MITPEARSLRAASWTHGLALATSGATVVLIVAGGLVTNTGAALAVPDWPTTFGHNMFVYPWSRMIGGVFYEHSHRLLGALVGLLTVSLGAAIWITERRGWLPALAVVAVVAVSIQGLLGGLRVVLLRDALAIVHGCLAQAFFALTAGLALVTAPEWRTGPVAATLGLPPAASRLALLAVGGVYLQIVLGALATHAGWIGLHLGGAAVAVAATAALAYRVLASRAPADLRRSAWGLGGLLGVQLALGLGAYVARFTGLAVPGGAVGVLVLPVAHRVAGALLLAATVTLALRIWRQRGAAVVGSRPVVRAEVAAA